MKKITTYLIIFLGIFGSRVYAQYAENWTNVFQYTTSSGYSNEGRKIAIDASGNVFALIDITSNIDSTGQPATTTQYYVVLQKYNYATGGLIAQKIINVNNMNLFGGHDYKASFGMELDASGNVYVGYTKYNSITNYDIGVNKYTNSLALSWTFLYTTGGIEQGIDMKLRGTNPFVLCKSTSGANTTYTIVKVPVGGGTSSIPLYSFTANTEVGNAMVTSSANDIFVTGYSLVSAVKSVLTASVSAAGVLKWKKTYNHNSATGDDFGSKLIIGSDGDIYVSGTTYTSAANGNDAMVLRYNNVTGNLIRHLEIHHALDDAGANIENGPAGYLFESLTYGNSISINKIITNSTSLLVYDPAQYLPVPVSPYTSLTGATIADMKVAASNNVYLCGSITGTSASGNFSASWFCKVGVNAQNNFKVITSMNTEGQFTDNYSSASLALDDAHTDILYLRSNWSNFNTHAVEQVFIADLDAAATLKSAGNSGMNSSVSEVSFYPNPASGKIYINGVTDITSVEICDLTGKVIADGKPVNNSIDISRLTPGLYFAKVISPSGTQVKRIIVQ